MFLIKFSGRVASIVKDVTEKHQVVTLMEYENE